MAVKNILKYLRRTKDLFLVYGEGDLQVSGLRMPVFSPIRTTVNLSQVLYSL